MISLRLAKPTDARELGELYHTCMDEIYGKSSKVRKIEECIQYFRNNKCNDTLIGIYDNRIVAFCCYGMAKDDTFYRDAGEIYGLYILKDYQRRGNGRNLLHEAVRKLRREEYNEIVTWIDPENEDAVAFFEALGFIQSNMEKEIISNGDSYTVKRYFRNI
ncbi:MAG: GNAT family N-acetyltransferase [Erysipelotrichaceae bacterium]|nr:GNAT family N-acetyltransferase [Erysipelotrichaceae bacterium]MBR2746146.1 GNAT family N-acetyltransferase [Erysipelotrichaceae bacterium]